MRSLQTVIINKKVMNYGRSSGISQMGIIDNDNQIFDDLVIHAVQQMFAYIDKLDLKRKLYSILQKIQNVSSQIHYFTYYQTKNIVLTADNNQDEDNDQDFEYVIDKLYYEKNTEISNNWVDKATSEQIMEMEMDETSILNHWQDIEQKKQDAECQKKIFELSKLENPNKNWVSNFEIFEKIDKILKFGFCSDFKGILIKLYIINVLVYESVSKYNDNFNMFNVLMETKIKYIKTKFNLKPGFEKIIKIFISEYLKDDPFILIGYKQISLYTSLLLYIMLIEKKIPPDNFTDSELLSMYNMRHELQEITELLVKEELKYKVNFNNIRQNVIFSIQNTFITNSNKIFLEYILEEGHEA